MLIARLVLAVGFAPQGKVTPNSAQSLHRADFQRGVPRIRQRHDLGLTWWFLSVTAKTGCDGGERDHQTDAQQGVGHLDLGKAAAIAWLRPRSDR